MTRLDSAGAGGPGQVAELGAVAERGKVVERGAAVECGAAAERGTAWLTAVTCFGLAANSVRLRRRVAALATIEASGEPVRPDHVFVTAAGVNLTPAQQRAASAHAAREGLAVLDLVPGQMAPQQVLDLARAVDPASYRTSRLAHGRGANHALLVDRDVLAASGVAFDGFTHTSLTPADLVTVTQTLKRFASVATDLAVLPGLHALPPDPAGRLAVRATSCAWDPAGLLAPLLRDAVLAAGVRSRRRGWLGWTSLATALSVLQPAVVAAGKIDVAPGGLPADALARRRLLVAALSDLAGTASAPPSSGVLGGPASAGEHRPRRQLRLPPRTVLDDLPARRRKYADDVTAGVDRFLEAPRQSCPWCGSERLSALFVGGDALMAKPGRFRYDRCDECAHVFQNPRLSLDGLDFYYRDAYDGLGAELVEEVFAVNDAYLSRARLPLPSPPKRWLDVGAGLGHFCNVARDVWPETEFDGLDLGSGIELAARRGWVDRAYRGLFPELVDELAGRYDVVSMFHYLEHTRDPLAELDAAAKALAPGAHLSIELPNPQSPAARWYGALWPGWFVPQHQHMMPADNVVAALGERGFEVLDLSFGQTHQNGDPSVALFGVLQRTAPSPTALWQPAVGPVLRRVLRARRVVVGTAVAAAMPAAMLVDGVTRPYLATGQRSNAYRILAKRS